MKIACPTKCLLPPEFKISVYLKWMLNIFQLLNICKYSFSSKEYTR